MKTEPRVGLPRAVIVSTAVFALLVGTLWAFPAVWYTGGASQGDFRWLAEQKQIEGWQGEDFGVGEAAEAILVGDRMTNARFTANDKGRQLQVFSAKRYLEKENEIGLFSHTPDRCWTGAGWTIEPIEPQYVDCAVHGVTIRFERRLFTAGIQSELVYFGALVGGKPLPYRLDQHLAACMKKTATTRADDKSTWLRLSEGRLWSWAWDSFVNRTALSGPQQFIRISTPVLGGDLAAADNLLRNFLPLWLKPVDYRREFEEWQSTKKASR